MNLDTVELILPIKDEFSIKISDEDAAKLSKVGDIAHHVVNASKAQTGTAFPFDQTYNCIKNILIRDFGAPEKEVKPEADIVFDLGLD